MSLSCCFHLIIGIITNGRDNVDYVLGISLEATITLLITTLTLTQMLLLLPFYRWEYGKHKAINWFNNILIKLGRAMAVGI